MKPTLQGRLNNPLTSELEALEQLAQSVELTPYAKKRLERLILCDRPIGGFRKGLGACATSPR